MAQLGSASPGTRERGRWKWFLGLGVALVILGITGVSLAGFLELSSVLVFGPLLLASSILQVLTAFLAERGKESLLHFCAAGVEAAFGFAIMVNPPQRVIGLVALVAIFFMILGFVRLVRALATRSRGRAWAIATGAVALLLGLSLWTGWPVPKLWFVGFCIGLDFLCQGLSWSALGLAEERTSLQPPAAGEIPGT